MLWNFKNVYLYGTSAGDKGTCEWGLDLVCLRIKPATLGPNRGSYGLTKTEKFRLLILILGRTLDSG